MNPKGTTMTSIFRHNNVLMMAMALSLPLTACGSDEEKPPGPSEPKEEFSLPEVNLACEPPPEVKQGCEDTTPDIERYERCVYDAFVLTRIQDGCTSTTCETRAFDAYDVLLSCEDIVSGQLGEEVTFRSLFPPKHEHAMALLDCFWGSVGK